MRIESGPSRVRYSSTAVTLTSQSIQKFADGRDGDGNGSAGYLANSAAPGQRGLDNDDRPHVSATEEWIGQKIDIAA